MLKVEYTDGKIIDAAFSDELDATYGTVDVGVMPLKTMCSPMAHNTGDTYVFNDSHAIKSISYYKLGKKIATVSRDDVKNPLVKFFTSRNAVGDINTGQTRILYTRLGVIDGATYTHELRIYPDGQVHDVSTNVARLLVTGEM